MSSVVISVGRTSDTSRNFDRGSCCPSGERGTDNVKIGEQLAMVGVKQRRVTPKLIVEDEVDLEGVLLLVIPLKEVMSSIYKFHE